MTSLEENKAIVAQAWEQVFNQGRADRAGEYFAEQYVEYGPDGTVSTRGLEQLKTTCAWMQRTFPDFHVTIADLIAEGDKVASRVMVTATQRGEYGGVAATCRKVQFAIMMVSRIADGKIVEDWTLSDEWSLFKQIAEISLVAKQPN
jgi:predicted ester cyclase